MTNCSSSVSPLCDCDGGGGDDDDDNGCGVSSTRLTLEGDGVGLSSGLLSDFLTLSSSLLGRIQRSPLCSQEGTVGSMLHHNHTTNQSQKNVYRITNTCIHTYIHTVHTHTNIINTTEYSITSWKFF